MSTLEKSVTWYTNMYKYIKGGYTANAWAAKSAIDLSRKYNADPTAIFDAVYAALTSKEATK